MIHLLIAPIVKAGMTAAKKHHAHNSLLKNAKDWIKDEAKDKVKEAYQENNDKKKSN